MSSTTTNMFAPRIWGFDPEPGQLAVARRAGWGRAELLWEHLMERANRARVGGERREAARMLRRAALVAKLFFWRDDLRRVTTIANRAILDLDAGRPGAAGRLHRAVSRWQDASGAAVATMQIAPRARSSLFHMRMEARHRDTYHDNMRKRIGRIADETAETLQALAEGRTPEHRHYGRWKGERPFVYDDTRRVLSACLMLFDA